VKKGKKMGKVNPPAKTPKGRSAPRGFRRLRRNEYLVKGDVYFEDSSGKFEETDFYGRPANWGLDVTPDLFYYRRIGAKAPVAPRAKGAPLLLKRGKKYPQELGKKATK
jgi:hypothetical protein